MTPLLNRRRPDDVVFAALSTEPRRLILRALDDRGPLSRAAIEELLGVPQTMSHEAAGRHLNMLVAAGLAVRFGGGTSRTRYRRDHASLSRALRRLGIVPVWDDSGPVDGEPRETVAPSSATDAL